jgi:ADP-heptose:LPS heptosyltransferase
MNVLVVNLTRMGDLLQTTPLLKGLKEQDPSGRLDLLVVEDFRTVAQGFDMVDHVLTLDLNSLIPQFEQQGITVVGLHKKLAEWMNVIRNRSYQRLINLSHTRISATLVRLLDIPDTRGVTLSQEGYILIRHPWLNYFFNVTLSRTYNPVNLVDIYLGAGDVKNPPRRLFYTVPHHAHSAAQAFLADHNPDPQRTIFGIQPGAMQESRRWLTSNWIKLCDLIWQELNGVAIIFGASADRDIAAQIETQTEHPVINAVGKTTIPELAALLTHCQTLVTNDTGTMHLAAAVKTPIVAVFLAAARSEDTAPYGQGHIILEANIDCAPCDYHRQCPNQVCHRMISPEVVLDAIEQHPARNASTLPAFPDQGPWKTVRATMTGFDQWGQSILEPCITRPLSRKQALSLAYRYLWRIELNRDPWTQDLSDYRQSLQSLLQNYLPPENPITFQHDIESLDKIIELASLGVERAAMLTDIATAPNPDLQQLQRINAHLVVIDNDIYDWELTHPDQAPLAIHFRIDKGNIEHDDLMSLAHKAKSLYGDLKRRSQRCQQLLSATEQIIALHQLETEMPSVEIL